MYSFSYNLIENTQKNVTRLAAFLRGLREEFRKTLRQVAEESKEHHEQISSSLLADAEKGKVIPSVPKLITLAKIYRIHPQRFIDLIDLDLQLENSESDSDIGSLSVKAKEAFSSGNYGQALIIYEQMIPKIDNHNERASAMNRKASCLWKLGKLNWARDEYENVLQVLGIENNLKIAAYNNLAEVFREMGNFELSRTMSNQALTIAIHMKDVLKEGIIYNSLANTNFDIFERLGRSDTEILDNAINGYKEAMRCFASVNQKTALAVATVNLGNSIILKKDYDKGEKYLKSGLELCIKEDNKRYISFAHCSLAKAYFETKNYLSAKQHFHKSEMVATTGDYFDLRFENNYYIWLISRTEGNEPSERKSFKTLLYLRKKIEGDFREIREFEKFVKENKL